MFHLFRLITFRHWLQSPVRTLITILGVSVGVATMVGITSINRSVLSSFRSTIDNIAGKADLSVSGSATGFDDGFVEKVKQVQGVTHVSAALTIVAPMADDWGKSLYVLGVDFLDDGFFRTLEGASEKLGTLSEDLELLNSTDRMLVTERFAKENKLRRNATFRLVTPEGTQTFFVHGILKESGAMTAFGGHMGVMYIASAQAAFGKGRNIDRIDVAVADRSQIETVKARIQAELPGSLEIDRPDRRGASVENMVRSFQLGLDVASGVAMVVGVFLVYNTISISVIQRRREIGTLRALGTSRRRIRTLFTAEAMAMGLAGTVFGLPIGWLIARLAVGNVADTVSSIYVVVQPSDVKLGFWELLLGAVLGVGGSVLSALRPAYVASRVHPVEVLRKDVNWAREPITWKSRSTLLGAFLCVLAYPTSQLHSAVNQIPIGGYAAVFMVLLGVSLLSPWVLLWFHSLLRGPSEWLVGVTGKMAADNFVRSPIRSAVPVSALSVGVAMAVCVAGFIQSFHLGSDRWLAQSIPADLFVTSASKLAGIRNAPMNESLHGPLSQIEGVAEVDKIRLLPHDVMGLRVFINSSIVAISSKHAKYVFLEGRAPSLSEIAQRHVIISENLMRRRGLHSGDSLSISTPTGVHAYIISGVRLDYTSDQGSVFMDRSVFTQDFKDSQVDTFEVYVKPGSLISDVRARVTEAFKTRYQLSVLSNQELRAEAQSMIEKAFKVTRAMELVAIVLALMGVVNTLLAAVLDRTREIGLLRAIGADRSHILRLFTVEASLMGMTGGLLGIASGVATGLILTYVIGVASTGWSFQYVFPMDTTLQMLVGATSCAMAAGLLPARRATSLDVVEALAYE